MISMPLVLNNLAALLVLRSWPVYQGQGGLPACLPIESLDGARQLVKLADKFPNDRSVTTLNRGRIAWLAGDCEQARTAWRSVIEISGWDSRVAFWQYWMNVDLALSENGAGSDFAQDIASYTRLVGDSVYSSEAYGAAADWYIHSFELAPDLSLAQRLVSIFKRSGDMAALERFLVYSAGKFPPDSAETLWVAGQTALLNGDYASAAASFGGAAENSDDPFGMLVDQASALQRQGDLAAAEQAYRAAIRARPEEYYPYFGLGQVFQQAGQLDLARQYFEKAAELNPN